MIDSDNAMTGTIVTDMERAVTETVILRVVASILIMETDQTTAMIRNRVLRMLTTNDPQIILPPNTLQPLTPPLNILQPPTLLLNTLQPPTLPLNTPRPPTLPLNTLQPPAPPLNTLQTLTLRLKSNNLAIAPN